MNVLVYAVGHAMALAVHLKVNIHNTKTVLWLLFWWMLEIVGELLLRTLIYHFSVFSNWFI